MTRHFPSKHPRRGLHAPRPDMPRILRRYELVRVKRDMRLLPDFFASFQTRTLHVMINSPERVEDVRWELAIILRDDGSICNTAWLHRPTPETAVAMAGLMSMHASLTAPMARVIDAKIPLMTKVRDAATVDDVLACIVQVARKWAGAFAAGGPGLIDGFQAEVAVAVAAAERLDTMLIAYSTTNQTLQTASWT